MRYRLKSYIPIFLKSVRAGVSMRGLVYSRIPFYFKTPSKPISLSIELTDACDLKCLYCNNPLFSNPRTFMSTQHIENLFNQLSTQNKIDRIRVGGGEPTLHPKFEYISQGLADRSKFLSIVTNVQWKKENIAAALLENYDLIELSVDAGGKSVYEESRVGADYELLIQNLEKIKTLKKKMKSKAHINLRFMIRPSNDVDKKKSYSFWKQYCDTIMPQYILQHFESDYDQDVYTSTHAHAHAFPKCTLPFKDLQIRSNGNIPLCQVTGSAINPDRKIILGNISTHSLFDIWNGAEMKKIRNAHKKRITGDMEVCKGCRGT